MGLPTQSSHPSNFAALPLVSLSHLFPRRSSFGHEPSDRTHHRQLSAIPESVSILSRNDQNGLLLTTAARIGSHAYHAHMARHRPYECGIPSGCIIMCLPHLDPEAEKRDRISRS
ncbi:hypothetical protein AB5N19_04953 [Seiridium cardinale]